jgi:hypothetical protein
MKRGKYRSRVSGPDTKPVIETRIVNGDLVFGGTGYSRLPITSADIAIARLLEGETVMIQQLGPLVTEVQLTVAGMLEAKGADDMSDLIEYEYRIAPNNPCEIQVQRRYDNQRKPPLWWRYTLCDSEAQANRIVALLQHPEDVAEVVLP